MCPLVSPSFHSPPTPCYSTPLLLPFARPQVELPGHEPDKELEVHGLLSAAGFHGLNKTQENEMNRWVSIQVGRLVGGQGGAKH